MTTMQEAHNAIRGYVAENSPIRLETASTSNIEFAIKLGEVAGFAIGSEPEIKHVLGGAVYQLKDEGVIETTPKGENSLLVNYVEPLEVQSEVPRTGYTAADLFGASDALWDQAAEVHRKLQDNPDPATNAELIAIYDQLGEIFNN
jgi:hypothetical protein